MPRYLIQWRSASGNGSWTGSREVDTGGAVPTSAAPVVEVVSALPNGQALEFRAVRLLENGAESAVVSQVGTATPSRFALESADPFGGTVRLAFTDQKSWRYYRIDRWTTATVSPSAGDVTSTYVDLGEGSGAKSTDVTGLTNGTTYRFRLHRTAALLGAIVRTGENVVAAAPDSAFEAPPDGYDASGPAEVSGSLKAQFVIASNGDRGILLTTKTSSYQSVTVSYVYVASGVSTTRSISWTSGSNFNSQNLGPQLTSPNSAKQFFIVIPSGHFPITIPDRSPAVQGARVSIDQAGTQNDFDVSPTYV